MRKFTCFRPVPMECGSTQSGFGRSSWPGPSGSRQTLSSCCQHLEWLPRQRPTFAPPSRLSSIATDSALPRLWLHETLCVEPIAQMTLVFGAITVQRGAASVE
jgi:hypothetical protein